MKQKTSGFTLIELMIVIVIIGILASIAYPSYSEYVFKARRADAHSVLLSIELDQQKLRASGSAYIAQTKTSPDGFYNVTVTTNSGGFVATAAPTGKQTGDSCGNITLTVSGSTTTYGPTNACWGK
jgi:type IV pilus assembly protein PilE